MIGSTMTESDSVKGNIRFFFFSKKNLEIIYDICILETLILRSSRIREWFELEGP